jgi:hypothetical protein
LKIQFSAPIAAHQLKSLAAFRKVLGVMRAMVMRAGLSYPRLVRRRFRLYHSEIGPFFLWSMGSALFHGFFPVAEWNFF